MTEWGTDSAYPSYLHTSDADRLFSGFFVAVVRVQRVALSSSLRVSWTPP